MGGFAVWSFQRERERERERDRDSWGLIDIHISSVSPVCDFVKVWREGRICSLSIWRGEEKVPLMATHWMREWRYSQLQKWRQPFILQAESLGSKTECQTVSTDRDMSKKVLTSCLRLRASNHCWERSTEACLKLTDWDGIQTDGQRSGCLKTGKTWHEKQLNGNSMSLLVNWKKEYSLVLLHL